MRIAVNSQTFSKSGLSFCYTDDYRCYDLIYKNEFSAEGLVDVICALNVLIISQEEFLFLQFFV